MTPYRVIHNIASLHFGGAQTFIMNIYNNIDREKVQFDFVVIPEERKDLYEVIESMGGHIFVCPRYNGKNHFTYCKWWNEFFSEHPEYHVIHGHVRSTAAIYLNIAKKHGLITIAHSHSTSNGKGITAIVKNILQFPIRNIADYLFACSDKAGIWLYGKKAIYKQNYKMIPNGVDLDRFAFNKTMREEMRRKLGINKQTFVVGHIGRFTEPKNHKYLIELFSILKRTNSDCCLLMVGSGELFDDIRTYCKELNIMDSVIMPGSCADTENFYQAMDVFVFPSLWEGLPVSVVEAQASGLNCLISDVITHDVDLTDLIHYIPLDKKDLWLAQIEKIQKEHRSAISPENMQKLQSFDSNAVAAQLQTFYINLYKRTSK